MPTRRAVLALADGRTFEGEAFGAAVDVVGEVVFNTSHAGYQEILTDPSYVGQIVTMTCPEMGNVGANPDDEESARPHAVGMVVKRCAQAPSSWRARETLGAYLSRQGLPGIAGLDTRGLTRHLRDHGAQMGALGTSGASAAALVDLAKRAPGMVGQDLASRISCKEPYEWTEGTPDVLGERAGESAPGPGQSPIQPTGTKPGDLVQNPLPQRGRGQGEGAGKPKHVVAFDFGLKRSMLRLLVDEGCRLTVVPAWTKAAEVLALAPDGIFLTNGPGDPDAVPGVRETVAELLGKRPVFGICLGHQILALALGGKTYKLKFGHRGANQPVKELATGKVDITCQNHGFAVDGASLAGRAEITHVNLNDGTVEGLRARDLPAFSVQYHPEASPGPHDARKLFGEFLRMMR
ncbi:MAG TPA: glutamine-hydrolyzing carbamoyl-phosphate synthase small subunit [Myxococcales bacterium]|nr:glutamine-hydrolyzing carbamoyl-phosphate synthase small subunit [Myxococcales bacterium]